MLAERHLERRRIVFNVIANATIGTGHVYRTLTLARRLTGHDITFIAPSCDELAVRLVEANGFRIVPFEGEPNELLRSMRPDIVVNDALDTKVDLIRFLHRELDAFVVNFEDLGPGAREADLVFNAMYGRSGKAAHVYSGALFECLREEFYGLACRPAPRTAARVLVTFGGSDPGGLTTRTLRALDAIPHEISIVAVLGLGYRHDGVLKKTIESMEKRVRLVKNAQSMSRLMTSADLIVTSYGRTLFEAAAVCVPAVALAQNPRELKHVFAHRRNGIAALGLGSTVTVAQLRRTLRRLIESQDERAGMVAQMNASGIGSGRDVVVDMILEHYRRRSHGNHQAR
jgi:spore coat polysaccharide biosynthesis predicted glycosyltransferase SpsG